MGLPHILHNVLLAMVESVLGLGFAVKCPMWIDVLLVRLYGGGPGIDFFPLEFYFLKFILQILVHCGQF